MRTTINNYLAAERARREEEGQSGFSLIELIIVVVVLGILAAIAIPVFAGIQDDAKTNAVKTTAANAASQVAASYAGGKTPSVTNFTGAVLSGTTIDDFCVTVTADSKTATSGPGCAAGDDD